MDDRPAAKPDAERITEPAMTRLLTRASELDAAYGAGSGVAELRAAALEAGISTTAFDAALAEMRGEEKAKVSAVRPQPRRMWGLVAGLVAVIVAGVVAVGVQATPRDIPALPEQSILLRCLGPGEAAQLVRPLLNLPRNSIVVSPETAPRVITIRATPEQMARVRAVLDQADGAGAPACARPPG